MYDTGTIFQFYFYIGGRRFPSSRFPTESIRSRVSAPRRFVSSPTFFLSRFKRQTRENDPGLNTIEVLSTRKPGKWRSLTKFRLPNSTYDHCTVSVNKTSLMIIGGYGQESQAAIVDLKYKTYRQMDTLKQPRRQVCMRLNFIGMERDSHFM